MFPGVRLFGILSALLALRRDLLQELQNAQRRTGGTRAVVFQGNEPNDGLVLEFKKEITEAKVQEKLQTILDGVKFTVCPLFPGEKGNLKMFFEVELPNIALHKISTGPFDLSVQLRKELDLESCDPVFDEPVGSDEFMARSSGGGDDQRPKDDERHLKNARMPDPVFDEPVGSDEFMARSSGGGGGQWPKDDEWHLKNARVPEAWEFSKGKGNPVAGEGVIIAQLDTGCADHSLLQGVVHPGGINYVDPPPNKPIDLLNYKGNPGHGTSVAAIAASRGKVNGKPTHGSRGSARNAKVMPFRVTKSVFLRSPKQWKDIAQGISSAKKNQARVISMSLGGIKPTAAVRAAILDAVKNDIIIVAAAGQLGGIPLSVVPYPAGDPNTIAVAGSTNENKPWGDSFRGKAVDISAPSKDIVHPARNKPEDDQDNVSVDSGTSYGTALTAGIAAMWLAHHGNDLDSFHNGLVKSVFEKCLKDSAHKPPGWDESNFGAGIINAERLLELKLPTTVPKTLRAPVKYQLTMDELIDMGAMDELISMGADPEFVRKLSEDDLKHFGNELLWLVMPTAGMREVDSYKVMSPDLQKKLGL